MENNMNYETIKTLAAEAICEWGKTHNKGCFLSFAEGVVTCIEIPAGPNIYNSPLLIWGFEARDGLKDRRWNAIAFELMNLYDKETKCRTHQKHSM